MNKCLSKWSTNDKVYSYPAIIKLCKNIIKSKDLEISENDQNMWTFFDQDDKYLTVVDDDKVTCTCE